MEKFLKRWEYQTTWPASCVCESRSNSYNRTWNNWLKTGKGAWQDCILWSCLFNLNAEYIMWNARLGKSQDGTKIVGRSINNLRYTDDTTLMSESEEELKSVLMRVKEENEIADLKLNIQKTKIRASSPITQWQIEREKVEARTYFIWAPKSLWTVTTSMKWKDTLWKENYDKLRQRITKQRYHFANKGPYSQSYGFSSIGCESWTIKKAECQRIDAFELWC